MKKDVITIVVPVYNTEEYLEECLDSLIRQSYSDIHIICVNDGSTDGSQEIIERYKNEDLRVSSYLIPNSGAASARNYGIDRFMEDRESDLITFVDSDDTVEVDFIEKLYETMLECNAEVSTCDLYRFKGDRGTRKKKLYTSKEATYEYFKDRVFYESPCCKLLKKETVNRVRFRNGKHYEDTFICYQWLSNVNSVAHIDYASYNVRVRSGSSTRAQYGNHNYDKVEAGLEIYEHYKGTEFENLAYNKYLGILFYFIIKTNGIKKTVNKNKTAIDEAKNLIKKNGFRNAGLRFYPFILATKLNLISIPRI
ncbi:MAG: glycosyltransferase family 2 protein [Erysipelotrichaceae bacterium]|nr:glycosyltransferase family 2 protein [Erysipelotrichaceae bacterium]